MDALGKRRIASAKPLLLAVFLAVAVVTSIGFFVGWRIPSPEQGQANQIYIEAVPTPENFTVQGGGAENPTIIGDSFHYVVVLKNPNPSPVLYGGAVTVVLRDNSTKATVYAVHVQLNVTSRLEPHSVDEVYQGTATIPENAARGVYVLQASATSSVDVDVMSEGMYVTVA